MAVNQQRTGLEQALQSVETRLRAIVADCDPIVLNYIREMSSVRGKQIRPRLMISQARLFGKANMESVATCAACCELLHTATLIHDDVIDQADTRRGNLTLNNKYGNEIAVVVGDYLLALVLKSVNSENDFRLNEMILSTSQDMGLGVIEEIHHRNNFELDAAKYYEVIYLKTAALFKLCCEMGAYLGGADDASVKLAGEYGKQLGLSFQVFDDLLDLTVDQLQTGKPSFNDLREGRITLPVIHGLAEEPARTRLLVEDFQAAPSHDSGLAIRDHLRVLGSLEYAHSAAGGFLGAARELSRDIHSNGSLLADSADLHSIEQQIAGAVSLELVQAAGS